MPSAQKPAGAEDAERALSRDQPSAAAAAVPTPANNGSASADGAEVISKEHQQNPLGNDDLLRCFLPQASDFLQNFLRSLSMPWPWPCADVLPQSQSHGSRSRLLLRQTRLRCTCLVPNLSQPRFR